MRISLCALCSLLFVALFAAPAAQAQGVDEVLEREAQDIDRMIMCPVCPAETIDQAQVEISFQMRAVIREMLAEGRSREEILDYFVDRYGPDILAAPPKSGVNLLAWILPIVGVAAGLGAVFLVIRAMTGRQRPAPVSAAAGASVGPGLDAAVSPEMAPYLEIADRLRLSRGTASRRSAWTASSASGSLDGPDTAGDDAPEGGSPPSQQGRDEGAGHG